MGSRRHEESDAHRQIDTNCNQKPRPTGSGPDLEQGRGHHQNTLRTANLEITHHRMGQLENFI